MEPLKSSLDGAIPGNSNKEKITKRNLPEKPVLSGAPDVKKENPFLTFYKAVFPGTLSSVKKSLWNRAVRTLQDTLYNTIVGFLDDYIYDGRGRSMPVNSPQVKSSLTNPEGYWNRQQPAPMLAPGYPFKMITYRTRDDADKVLEAMIGYFTDYQKVPVAFYYDYSQQSVESTDWNWGWRSLDGVIAKPEGNGYILTLPPPQAL